MSLKSCPPLDPEKYAGNGETVCPDPVSPPVLMLHDDLLWSIFSWIANMKPPRKSIFFPEPRALTSTCQCSQVCQNWRRILLHASSLWGNVLDLDALSLGNDNWRNEILRRTGISLLSVSGIQQPLGRSKSSREFFYSLLEKNWDRIRLLHISHDEQPVNMHGKIDEIRWSRILSFPAKNLESFQLSVSKNAFPSGSPRILRSNSAGLFNNSAPMLTEVKTSRVQCSTSFFSHLRTFSMNFQFSEFNVGEFLNALRKMNLLEELTLTSFFPCPINQQRNSTPVFLPRLMNINLNGAFHCTAILDNIQPVAGRILELVVNDRTYWEHELWLAALGTICRCSKDHFITYPTASLCVALWSSCVYTVANPHNNLESFSSNSIFALLRLRASLEFSSPYNLAPTIYLQLNIPAGYYGMVLAKNLLSILPSVVMLECEERTIEKLNRIPGVDRLMKGLEILKLTRMIAYERENFRLFTLSNGAPAPLLHFLFKRWETGHPIQLLDLTSCRGIECYPGGMRVLEKLSGLKVIWGIDCAKHQRHEYKCGAGNQSSS